jgi:crossover junction endodeoxyribonuclease RuvC
MILLAIDSGLEKTGYALFEKRNRNGVNPHLLESGLIKTARNQVLQDRLAIVYIELEKKIRKYKPDLVVLEQLFFYHNQKTAIQVSQSQGVIMLLCSQYHIETVFLTPLQIKQIITGYGQSDKKAVQKMLKLTLDLSIPPSRDDETDAIACGLAYCYLNNNLVK